MVGFNFSSDAWNSVTFIAGEMKNPQRNIGLSLFSWYVDRNSNLRVGNLMYVAVLPLHDIAFAEKRSSRCCCCQYDFWDMGAPL